MSKLQIVLAAILSSGLSILLGARIAYRANSDLLYDAAVLIAAVDDGSWSGQSPTWQVQAAVWRGRFFRR